MNSELKEIQRRFDILLQGKEFLFPNQGDALDAPIEQGVYVIYDSNQTPLHVGKTSRARGGLKQRLKNHLHGQSSFTKKHFNGAGHQLRGQCSFKYVTVDNPRIRTLLEAYALSHLCPIHLGVGVSD